MNTINNQQLNITAIICAAGRGSRAKLEQNKVLFTLEDGLTVLKKATLPFDKNTKITQIIYTSNEDDLNEIEQIANTNQTPTKVVLGGQTRFHSVLNALKAVTTPFVLVHDGARPFVTEQIVSDCIDCVIANGSAVATCLPVDTIAEIDQDGNIVSSTRTNRLLIQTPQGFKTQELLKAYLSVENPSDFTDESGIYSKYITRAHACKGSPENKKLTTASDFAKLLHQRTGVGYDLHQLVENRRLILGGIEIPHDKGLLGHSDADVLTHAIMDALLSALSLRDIGYHFSDKDAQYKDISSMILLERVLQMIKQKGYKPSNLSAVIMAEKPKLSPFIPQITANLANALGVSVNQIGITCTTTESVGLVGREQAIAVHAVCTLTHS